MITVPVGSVPEGGKVSVPASVPVLTPVIVVYGPVNEVCPPEVGSTTVIVPAAPVPDGRRDKIVVVEKRVDNGWGSLIRYLLASFKVVDGLHTP